MERKKDFSNCVVRRRIAGCVPIEEPELLAVAVRDEIGLVHLLNDRVPHAHAVAHVTTRWQVLVLQLRHHREGLYAELEQILRAEARCHSDKQTDDCVKEGNVSGADDK